MNIQLVVQYQTISGPEKIKGWHLAMQRPLRMILQEVGLFLLHLAHYQSSFGVSVCKLVCPTLFGKFGCEVIQKLQVSVSILHIQDQRKNLILLLIHLVNGLSNGKDIYVVLLVKLSNDCRCSLDELPKRVTMKVIKVKTIKMALGMIIVAASGASKFNQHLKSEFNN